MKKTPIRILVVEDNDDDLVMVRESLGAAGDQAFEVVPAGRLSEAAEKLAPGGIDLILLDLGLPDGSGLACVDSMRLAAPNVPLIVLSGNQDEDLARKAVQTGAQDYLFKGEIVGRQLPRAIRYAIERKFAHDQVRTAKERYETLLESIPDAVYSALPDPRLPRTFVSERWYGWTGVTPEACCKDPEAWLGAVHPEDRERVREAFAEAVRERSEWMLDYRIVHGTSGRPRNVRDHAVPIKDQSGKIIRYDGIVADMTEIKEMESRLGQARKMEAVGRLAAGVAHEFNNKLTVINGNADFLRSELDPGSELHQIAEDIKTAGTRAAEITGQLLAFSRQQVLEAKVLNLNDELKKMRKDLRQFMGDGIEVIFSPGPDLSPVKLDPGRFEQVIMNLAINARDAMLEGGRLRIVTENFRISRSRRGAAGGIPPGDYVKITVTDGGPGMPKEILDKIFEPFFTTKALGRGAGLGLAIVEGIVKQSGGHLQVSSRPQEGTSFEILLPSVSSAPIRTKATELHDGVQGGSDSILVVEDEPALRQLVVRILRSKGYEVIDAPDGYSALELVEDRSEPVALLLTDLIMPEMTGSELAKRLTARWPETRIVFMSGYVDEEFVELEIKKRGRHLLQKPFHSPGLLKSVREALDAPRKPAA